MGLTQFLRETAVSLTDKFVLPGVVNMVNTQSQQSTQLQERLAELELALEDMGWTKVLDNWEKDFSRQGLGEIMRLSRLMWLKNPIIKRGVEVQALYVFGQGVTIRAEDKLVNRAVQRFLEYRPNRTVLTSQPAMVLKEQELQVYGNIYFCLWPNPSTGDVRVTTIPADEVKDIICDPDDAATPQFYLREWSTNVMDLSTGNQRTISQKRYYRALSSPAPLLNSIGSVDVQSNCVVHHVKVCCLSDMRWGTPETYISLDWAKAYKEFLEDWCTVNRSHAKWAWKFSTKGGDRGVRNAKARLNTTISTASGSSIVEHNPPPLAASTFIGTDNIDMAPMKTAGMTTSANEGRRIFLMAAAGAGLPETFYGDVSVGTLATAKTMDRPTELKFKSRQTTWAEILRTIVDFALDSSATAPQGLLYGKFPTTDLDPILGGPNASNPAINPVGQDRDDATDLEDGAESEDQYVEVTFPSILQHDIAEQIQAVVQGATLGGNTLAGTMDMKTVSGFILRQLGYEEVDEILEQLFPEGYDPQQSIKDSQATKAKPAMDPNDPNQDPDGDPEDDSQPPSKSKPTTAKTASTKSQSKESIEDLSDAVSELREALVGFIDKYHLRETLAAMSTTKAE